MSLQREEFFKRIGILIVIVSLWILIIIRYAQTLPKLYIPHSIEDVKAIASLLVDYSRNQRLDMLVLYSLVYLFKQMFGIPGALIFNIIAGVMYGILGLPLVCFLVATGATGTYILSKYLIGHIIFGTCISRSTINSLKARVDEHGNNLLLFVITIRSIPLVPGSLVSLASPFIGIPVDIFFIGTLVGSIPYVFICVQAASTLATIQKTSDIFRFWVIVKLILIALAIIVPMIFKNQILEWIKRKSGTHTRENSYTELPLYSV